MTRHCQPLESRRHFAAGDPVEAFGHHGIGFAPTELQTVEMSQVAPTPDGKLLAGVGYQFYRPTRSGTPADFIRFNADGTPDTTFGGTGYVDSVFNTVRRIAVRSDGRFYALASLRDRPTDREIEPGAESAVNGVDNWFIARFLPNGQPDRSFGRRGKVGIELDRTLREVGGYGGFTNVSSFLDTDGRLTLLANYQPRGMKTQPAVFRYDATGAPDLTFNGGRPVLLQTDGARWSDSSITLGNNGDVFISAVHAYRRRYSTVVEHLKADGNNDLNFGSNGLLTVAKTQSTLPTSAVASDGSLFVSDSQTIIDTAGQYVTTKRLWKFGSNGASDRTFAPWSRSYQYELASLNAVLPTDDGGAIIDDNRLNRITANGTPDSTFGTVQFASEMPVLANNRIYGIVIKEAAYEVNVNDRRVAHYGVSSISLGGTDLGPLAVTHRRLTLTGTSDSELISFFPGTTGRKITSFFFSRGLWGRLVPVAAFDSIDVYGEAGNDVISAYVDNLLGRTVTLHGGPGDDFLESRVRGVIAYGDAGNDGVNAVIKKLKDDL